ncbi:hypothetical protein CVT26_002664 [Gymnopilus dilepis]|uniref:Secreted protein n=1 Tax=Gymnopilus dilepis TaxID=231916 RepID=A0A409VF10_9AGAR|nr:hypothetical protein CVT26_002664 [Gymnopilus dilepis]
MMLEQLPFHLVPAIVILAILSLPLQVAGQVQEWHQCKHLFSSSLGIIHYAYAVVLRRRYRLDRPNGIDDLSSKKVLANGSLFLFFLSLASLSRISPSPFPKRKVCADGTTCVQFNMSPYFSTCSPIAQSTSQSLPGSIPTPTTTPVAPV